MTERDSRPPSDLFTGSERGRGGLDRDPPAEHLPEARAGECRPARPLRHPRGPRRTLRSASRRARGRAPRRAPPAPSPPARVLISGLVNTSPSNLKTGPGWPPTAWRTATHRVFHSWRGLRPRLPPRGGGRGGAAGAPPPALPPP